MRECVSGDTGPNVAQAQDIDEMTGIGVKLRAKCSLWRGCPRITLSVAQVSVIADTLTHIGTILRSIQCHH